MIASSLKEEDGLVEMLLRKGADATIQNNAGQVKSCSQMLRHSAHVQEAEHALPFFFMNTISFPRM